MFKDINNKKEATKTSHYDLEQDSRNQLSGLTICIKQDSPKSHNWLSKQKKNRASQLAVSPSLSNRFQEHYSSYRSSYLLDAKVEFIIISPLKCIIRRML